MRRNVGRKVRKLKALVARALPPAKRTPKPFSPEVFKRFRALVRKREVIKERKKGFEAFFVRWYAGVASGEAIKKAKLAGFIVKKGQVTPDGTIARHNVEKLSIKGINIAKKRYEGAEFDAKIHIYEASALLEAKKRGLPVVDVVRVISSKKRKVGYIYTIMPYGFSTLAESQLRVASPKEFLSELGKLVGKMHKAGIKHNDLDLENVLWNKDPKRPSFILLDFEAARFYKKQPPFEKVQGDVGTLIESLCNPARGLGVFSREELRYFVDAYCKETGYAKEDVAKVIESAFPSQPLEELREEMRKNLLGKAGVE